MAGKHAIAELDEAGTQQSQVPPPLETDRDDRPM